MDYQYRSPLDGSYEEESSSGYGYTRRQNDSRSASNSRTFYPSKPYTRTTGEYSGHSSRAPSQLDYSRYGGAISTSQPRYGDRHRPPVYPRELTDLFGALECRLCGVDVLSPIVAKMHYSGKQHAKKVKNYLLEWSERTGQPMPKVEEPFATSSMNSMPDYCELCDVKLTSINDKVLHYSGKNHLKNERDPGNARKRKRLSEAIDMTGVRFGIGSDFQPEKAPENNEHVNYKDFICYLCDVNTVSLDQLEIHLQGKKHKEKLEKKSQSHLPKTEKPYTCKLCDVALATAKLYQMHLEGKRHAKSMLKMDMDGSGTDYCDVCEVTFTCYEQYQAHVVGKRHEKKCKEKYEETMRVEEENCQIACKSCPFVGNMENHKCDESLLNIDHTDLEKKWVCFPCHNMVFESEEEYKDHKHTRRHMLCVLNQEDGDKVVPEMECWYCFVCKKQYRTNADFTGHLFEERHLSLSNAEELLSTRTDIFKCTVCNVVMDEQAKDEHMRDRRHLRKTLKKDTISALTNLANQVITTNTFQCANCQVELNSFIAYSNHMLGDEHMERMINMKLSQKK